ncbi:glutathionylspermidine synthase family protein [Aliamphritea hakodatensis]|uniref:glutathionylspermidine synthase family protein n=1 Tax=Aliamphritea hakodatensis TaxID=2895352 RepID=UPI0022FD5325|nr:glutathionylspermidine synthase family protein [Aliamphritea hakodatensis]
MQRHQSRERPGWQSRAAEFGFTFHTMYGEPYWDESIYYEFSLQQIENHIEDPTEELHRMCLAAVDEVVSSEALMAKFQIPDIHRDLIRHSWLRKDPSLYSRMDLAYNGSGPAKLYENNADTPTSLYETGFWQWLWLEDKIHSGDLPKQTDQYNSLQEKLIERFREIRQPRLDSMLHFACAKDTDEDRGTVQYLQDCASEAGIRNKFTYVEDIGHGVGDVFTDIDSEQIRWMFKLYPWEFMLREDFGDLLQKSAVSWLEPPWKALVSNKAILPLLWKMFPGHPNLLPSYFEEDMPSSGLSRYVRKPIFAREGANVSIHVDGQQIEASEGPYGKEGFIYQEYCPLPRFAGNHTLIGSWLINDRPAGMSVREDSSQITQDLSRFVPHIILD